MSEKVIAYGGSNGQNFDDGVYEGTYDGVRKLIVGEDSHGIVYLKIQYVKNGDVVLKEHGRARGTHITETEFEVKCPDEYITSIWGTYRNDDHRYKSTGGSTSGQLTPAEKYDLYLAANMGSPMYTNTVSELQFKTSHGRTSEEFGMPGPGGSNGVSWDDGAYDGLNKLCVGEDDHCVSSVEFHYVKGNDRITHCHGKDSKEHGFISSLTFKTSMNRSSEKFGTPVGTKFKLEAKGLDKIVGFRGRSSVNRINALGANFAVVVVPPVKKLNAKGGVLGKEWDDGIHDDVRMITFKLYFNNEYITSVELDTMFNTNRTTYQVLSHSPEYTYEGTSFKLEEKDHKIVGFYGKTEVSLNQIGPIANA
ncbi:jacalin lectin family protein [Arabidopsis lyrata subsp. lyrata]|uniref:Jacalin lectin family protein n=1 Tax=Arabidopsis lyrata subsp. lyrata TaxID=81972 RepID=D7MSN5_ARALL|nr:jacalin lectin family protein [Arabidopsis lyrata subsp. lyrata]